MAALIFNEQFPETTSDELALGLKSRGWTSGGPTRLKLNQFGSAPGSAPGSIAGYHSRFDTTLNKHVLSAVWPEGDTLMPGTGFIDGNPPGGSGSVLARVITQKQWDTGITIYTAQKYHNVIHQGGSPGNGLNWHAGLRMSSNGTYGSGNGEIMLEAARDHMGYATFPSGIPGVDNYWTILTEDNRGETYWGDDNIHGYITDDQWYEQVVYINTDNGGNNGRLAMWYRLYGDTDWIKLFDIVGYQITTAHTAHTQFVGFGPYLHTNVASGEVTSELGWMTVWTGDAMADGQISNAPDPVEPDPVEPDPVEPDPVEPDPVEPDPVISGPTEPLTGIIEVPSVSIAMDGANQPHIAYYDPETKKVTYSYKVNDEWVKEELS